MNSRFYTKIFPSCTIIIGNVPVVFFANFELWRDTIDTILAILAILTRFTLWTCLSRISLWSYFTLLTIRADNYTKVLCCAIAKGDDKFAIIVNFRIGDTDTSRTLWAYFTLRTLRTSLPCLTLRTDRTFGTCACRKCQASN